METRLNGENPYSLLKMKLIELLINLFNLNQFNFTIFSGLIEDNPVPNSPIRPKQQPGVYKIICLENNKRYYGESSNISGRLSQHKSNLKRKIHFCKELQQDWNTFGKDKFEFIVLFQGPDWESKDKRIEKQTELNLANLDLLYNKIINAKKVPPEQNPFYGKKHSEETKQLIRESLTGVPNEKLGKKIIIKGVIYPSLAEAERQLGYCRKTIRKKLNDPKELDWQFLDE